MMKEKSSFRPRLRDGVDVYFEPGNVVTFVFLASRKRLKISCHEALAKSLIWLSGEHEIYELCIKFKDVAKENGLHPDSLYKFIQYLEEKGIVISENWLDGLELPQEYKYRLDRQLNFLLDVVESPKEVLRVQKNIYDAVIVVFGVGAIGSWITRQLAMMGFRKFILVDHDVVSEFDVSRHSNFKTSNVGQYKTEVIKSEILSICPEAEITSFQESLTIEKNVYPFAQDATLIINTADKPYIGYTSVKLSRFCIEHSIPLLVAGGFDAHLGSTGELIIPGVTPCSDCYSNYFSKALEGWRPTNHPVIERETGFGGLVSLSVFSASTACMTILRYFSNPNNEIQGGRAEFLFDNYSTTSFQVDRDPNCKVCGDNNDNK